MPDLINRMRPRPQPANAYEARIGAEGAPAKAVLTSLGEVPLPRHAWGGPQFVSEAGKPLTVFAKPDAWGHRGPVERVNLLYKFGTGDQQSMLIGRAPPGANGVPFCPPATLEIP